MGIANGLTHLTINTGRRITTISFLPWYNLPPDNCPVGLPLR
jgi:hypothetical protein